MPAVLTLVCLFSDDVPALAAWYRQVLEIEPVLEGSEYAELRTGPTTRAIFERRLQNELVPGSASSGTTGNAIVEFQVRDVDAEYRRLLPIKLECVKPPTTHWWGNRSVYLRDPEGNLIDLYSTGG
jgi:catechol 2,3-dioxygenase-like lactoylglutathione lyase family enzyme